MPFPGRPQILARAVSKNLLEMFITIYSCIKEMLEQKVYGQCEQGVFFLCGFFFFFLSIHELVPDKIHQMDDDAPLWYSFSFADIVKQN